MWSAGCVFAEMYFRKALFGEKDFTKQVIRLVSLLGEPPCQLMDNIQDEGIKAFIQKVYSKSPKVRFEDILPGIEEDALDLLRKLLEYDPTKRISAEEALAHPYFADLHSKQDEP